MRASDKIKGPRQAVAMGGHGLYEDKVGSFKGEYTITMTDPDGKVVLCEKHNNIETLDGGVYSAIMFGSGATPSPPSQRGVYMLAIGTGATGPVNNPDAPDPRQRVLNAEIARQTFTSTVYRTQSGAVSSVPTNVIDYTANFGSGVAVGPLNEMSLIRPISTNPAVRNPVPATFPTYDPTIDLTLWDVCVNYSTFGVINKPTNFQ